MRLEVKGGRKEEEADGSNVGKKKEGESEGKKEAADIGREGGNEAGRGR